MTVDELILLDKHKVRRYSNLMHLYLQFFEEAFGRVPNCAGCSFGSDWSKLVAKYSKNSVTLQKVNLMKTIEIKKKQGKILTYKKEGKTYRLYDNMLNDKFIKEYIEFGVDGTKDRREKMFSFPKVSEEEVFSVLGNKTVSEFKDDAKDINELFIPKTEYQKEISQKLDEAVKSFSPNAPIKADWERIESVQKSENIQPRKRGRKPKK